MVFVGWAKKTGRAKVCVPAGPRAARAGASPCFPMGSKRKTKYSKKRKERKMDNFTSFSFFASFALALFGQRFHLYYSCFPDKHTGIPDRHNQQNKEKFLTNILPDRQQSLYFMRSSNMVSGTSSVCRSLGPLNSE